MLSQLFTLMSLYMPKSKSEKGQDLAEYALLLGLIALVVVAAITLAGTQMDLIFDAIVTELQGAVP